MKTGVHIEKLYRYTTALCVPSSSPSAPTSLIFMTLCFASALTMTYFPSTLILPPSSSSVFIAPLNAWVSVFLSCFCMSVRFPVVLHKVMRLCLAGRCWNRFWGEMQHTRQVVIETTISSCLTKREDSSCLLCCEISLVPAWWLAKLHDGLDNVTE